METGRPSRTAWRAAHARARHQADPRRVFTDPLASKILRLGPGALPPLPDDPVARYNIRFVAARSRFAEDALAAAVSAGTRQLVVLGAGLDTFACRHPHTGLRVFEVDHPDTQEWKRRQLAAAGIAVPPSLVFAPLDFERGTLDGALDAAGLDRTRAAFFSWLGVTPYLTRDAVLATLRAVAAHPALVQVVFDYYREPAAALAPELRAAYEAATRQVAELGEPWLSHFTPDGLAGELRAMGLTDIEDLAGPDLLARYLGEPAPAADAFSGQVLRAGRTAGRRAGRPSRSAPSPPGG
ncbi:class I SAM-dependent methyltransferase [Streptomyces angustmyceticus]|uniref:class I SAM-dependent methyltransferase n=1 Tax=Streptomyces angustmyceticus TaxID=285578 RepID=UPI00380FCC82